MIHVLTDLSESPRVVDVRVERAHTAAPRIKGAAEEEIGLGPLLEKRLPSAAPETLRQYLRGYAPQGAPQFNLVRSIARVPTKPGLYVLQWSRGQYLGKADNLRDRLVQHQGSMRRYGLNPFHFQMYVATMTSNPRKLDLAAFEALYRAAW